MCAADCWTDNRLVASKLHLFVQPVRRPQGKKVLKRLDVSKLKQDRKRQAFINDIYSRLDALEHSSEDVDENWMVFRVFGNGFPRTSISQTSRLVWWEWQENAGAPWRETQKHTSLTPAQYLVRLPIQTYVRQSRLGSETCKTPGLAKRLMKSSPLQRENKYEVLWCT